MSTEDNRTWNPVGWFEIYVTEMDQAKAFYGDVAQCDFTPAPMSGGDMEMWFFGADPSLDAQPECGRHACLFQR